MYLVICNRPRDSSVAIGYGQADRTTAVRFVSFRNVRIVTAFVRPHCNVTALFGSTSRHEHTATDEPLVCDAMLCCGASVCRRFETT